MEEDGAVSQSSLRGSRVPPWDEDDASMGSETSASREEPRTGKGQEMGGTGGGDIGLSSVREGSRGTSDDHPQIRRAKEEFGFMRCQLSNQWIPPAMLNPPGTGIHLLARVMGLEA